TKLRYAVTCCDERCERRSKACFTVQVHPVSAGFFCCAARNGWATERGLEEPVKTAAANLGLNQRNKHVARRSRSNPPCQGMEELPRSVRSTKNERLCRPETIETRLA